MKSWILTLFMIITLQACNEMKFSGVEEPARIIIEAIHSPITFNTVTNKLTSTITITAKNKSGSPVQNYAPPVSLSANSSATLVCPLTNASGVSSCALTSDVPLSTENLQLKSSSKDAKISSSTLVTLQPAPTISGMTPSVIDHDLATQSLSITGNFFHSGMKVFIGSVECLNLVVTSANNLTCDIGTDAAGIKNVTLQGLDTHQNVYGTYIERRDITSPSAPVVALNSSALTSSLSLSFTVADCLDRPYIQVTDSLVAPGASSGTWQSCVTSAGGITHSLTGPAAQGNHTVYVWAKDSSDNVSSSTSLSVVYDNVTPAVSFTAVPTLLAGGQSLALTFSSSDTNGLSALRLDYAADGSTYSLVQNLSTSATTYTWTVPSAETTTGKLRIVSSDNATSANVTTEESVTFTIDSTAPTPPVASLAALSYSNTRNIATTISSCADTPQILINMTATVPSKTDPAWVTCTTAALGTTYQLPNSQGSHALHIWGKDAAGNVSTTSRDVTVIYDSVAPVLSITAPGNQKGGASVSVSFSLTEINASSAQTFTVSYNNGSGTTTFNPAVTTGPLTSAAFSQTITIPSSDNTALSFTVDYTDLAGNSATASVNFRSDMAAPIIDSLSMNGGTVATFNNNILVALAAHDAVSPVEKFCLKYDDPTLPAANSSCWRNLNAPSPGVTPAQSISFNNYYFQIGFSKSIYTTYVWVMDQAGYISTNTDTLNVDKFVNDFDPGSPPSISKLQVTNSDASVDPVPSSDLIVSAGADLYVKWNASDAEGLPANPISVAYSVNDTTYTAFTGGTNISNSANGGCSVSAGFTGCARLAAPTSSYFKVRVIVKDDLQTTFFYSTALNDTKLKVLAGNTEDGLDGSARSAMFFTRQKGSNFAYSQKHTLAVSEDGKFFYIDPIRGLLWINPMNGVLSVFIPTTGTSSGNGGPVTSATLESPRRVALDHQNRLLVWDEDEIRRVDLSTMIITSVLGGGATVSPSGTVPASTISLAPGYLHTATFLSLPNGDIILREAENSLSYRRYRAADQMVELMKVSGPNGTTQNPSIPWSGLSYADLGIEYNETTSAFTHMVQNLVHSFPGDTHFEPSRIDFSVGSENSDYVGSAPYNLPYVNSNFTTGLNGKLYIIERTRTALQRYDSATNTLVNVLGVYGQIPVSPCPDLTPATSCKVDIDTVFISRIGRPYFVDQGLIRSLNDNNEVITLFGQFPSYGDNVLATSARFGTIQDVQFGKANVAQDKIVVLDSYSSLFREFTIGGNSTNLADSCTAFHGPWRFATNPSTGEIYSGCGIYLRSLERTGNTWQNIVGGGPTRYYDSGAEGEVGSQIDMHSGYNAFVLGFINNNIFYNKYSWNGTASFACQVNKYDATDSYRQSHFMGDLTCDNNFSVGSPVATNAISQNVSNMEYDSTLGKYLYARFGGSIYMSSPGGNLELFKSMPYYLESFTHVYDVNGLNIYFCDGGGALRKYNYNSDTFTHLTWSSSSISCKYSSSILYRSSTNSLIFPARQNGLDMIVEYNLN